MSDSNGTMKGTEDATSPNGNTVNENEQKRLIRLSRSVRTRREASCITDSPEQGKEQLF